MQLPYKVNAAYCSEPTYFLFLFKCFNKRLQLKLSAERVTLNDVTILEKEIIVIL